jgi:hypothetical protein
MLGLGMEARMASRALQFAAVLLTALALAPAGAHLFALPNKIALPQGEYFAAQQVYAGWQFLGAFTVGALIANAALAFAMRGQKGFGYALAAALLIAATLAIFFAAVFPGNQQTANWTSVPRNWEVLRRNWEYGHAASAVLTLIAFCCTSLSVMAQPRPN